MASVVIENPVINSPYEEPKKHFVFDEDGITDEIAETRRRSSYFIPIPPPKKRTPQTALPGTWAQTFGDLWQWIFTTKKWVCLQICPNK